MIPIALARHLTTAIRSAAELASWWMFRMSVAEWLILAQSFADTMRLNRRIGTDQDGNQPK
jgi:hypothetical protein